ncbi:MAG: lipid A export permease/ATP-binding protein MsbA [Burkholderiales bacterium]|nr:lipid A export permease/ATP-binding protein MsbA [Burkholderiales bacterium]
MAVPETKSRVLYARLLRYVVPYWRMFALSIVAMALVAATEPLLPALMKPLLDGSFVSKDPTTIRYIPFALVGLFLVRGVFGFVSDYALSWVSNRVVFDLRAEMFGRMVNLPTRYYDDASSGALISKLSYDVTGVMGAATSVLTVMVRDTLTVAGLLAWMFYLDWKLSLITLVIGPVIAVVIRSFSSRLRQVSREAQRAMGDITHVLDEAIGCHKVVKVFGGQEYEQRHFGEAIKRMRNYAMRHTIAAGASVPLVQVCAAIAVAVIVYYSTRQGGTNGVTVGSFVSFMTATLMLLSPLKRLTGVNAGLQRGLAAAESVFAVVDEEPEEDNGTQTLDRAQGRIVFDHLCFSYPNASRPALDDINLEIAAGETVALVGGSGGGKTTLANLIPRFYQPSAGRILLDGIDTQTLTLASLRANLALVSQDVVLFNDTIAANIAYGPLAGASEAAIVAAAEAAHAMEFIREMPEGLQTMIGENGVRLSGGQRQRIAIARALLKDAPVLILDEATSALDTESERVVQAALDTLMQGRTTLIIAHRLSTIEKANRIVVLQHGKIAEVGSHAELLAHDGRYAYLYKIQFAAEDDASEQQQNQVRARARPSPII